MVWRLERDAGQPLGIAERKKMRRVDLLPGAFWNGAELDRLQGGKEARCVLLFEEGEELFDFVGRIDYFDGNGEVFCEAFDFEGVDRAGIGAESHKSSVDGGAGQLACMGLCNNPFIERPSVVFICFPCIDPQYATVFNRHRSFP